MCRKVGGPKIRVREAPRGPTWPTSPAHCRVGRSIVSGPCRLLRCGRGGERLPTLAHARPSTVGQGTNCRPVVLPDALRSCSSWMVKHEPGIVGWREWVRLPDLGDFSVKAKVDTGARTSAIHAFDIESFVRDGQEWVTFELHPVQHRRNPKVAVEAVIKEHRRVRSSNGTTELRPVISTTLVVGGTVFPGVMRIWARIICVLCLRVLVACTSAPPVTRGEGSAALTVAPSHAAIPSGLRPGGRSTMPLVSGASSKAKKLFLTLNGQACRHAMTLPQL